EADKAGTHRKLRSHRYKAGQLAGNESQFANRASKRKVASGALDQKPDDDVDRDDQSGHDRRSQRFVFVAVGKHSARLWVSVYNHALSNTPEHSVVKIAQSC